jgi:hypothetical protein
MEEGWWRSALHHDRRPDGMGERTLRVRPAAGRNLRMVRGGTEPGVGRGCNRRHAPSAPAPASARWTQPRGDGARRAYPTRPASARLMQPRGWCAPGHPTCPASARWMQPRGCARRLTRPASARLDAQPRLDATAVGDAASCAPAHHPRTAAGVGALGAHHLHLNPDDRPADPTAAGSRAASSGSRSPPPRR